MPVYKGQLLTAKGEHLLAKVLARDVPTQFSRIVIGDGVLASGVDWTELTAPKNAVHSMQIISKKVVGKKYVELQAVLKSGNIERSFRGREICIYAVDPDEGEIMYSYEYVGEQGDLIPAFGENTYFRRVWNLMISVANASQVTIIFQDLDDAEQRAASVAEEVAMSLITDKLEALIRDLLVNGGMFSLTQKKELFIATEGQMVFTPTEVDATGVVLIFVNGAYSSDWEPDADGNIILLDQVPEGTIVEARQILTNIDKEATGSGTSTTGSDVHDITLDAFERGVIQTTVRSIFAAQNASLATEKAVREELDTKVDKQAGKGLSTEDFTTTEKVKLAGLTSGSGSGTTTADPSFNTVKVGDTSIAASVSNKTLSLIAGKNITLTPDSSGKAVTFDASGASAAEADFAWHDLDSSIPGTTFNAYAIGDNGVIAVATSSGLFTSTDGGMNFYGRLGGSVADVKSTPDGFLVVGSNALYASTEGVDFSTIMSGVAMSKCAYGGGWYVAYGGAAIYASQSLKTGWASRYTYSAVAMKFLNGRWIAYTGNALATTTGKPVISADESPLSWSTPEWPSIAYYIKAVVYFSDHYVFVLASSTAGTAGTTMAKKDLYADPLVDPWNYGDTSAAIASFTPKDNTYVFDVVQDADTLYLFYEYSAVGRVGILSGPLPSATREFDDVISLAVQPRRHFLRDDMLIVAGGTLDSLTANTATFYPMAISRGADFRASPKVFKPLLVPRAGYTSTSNLFIPRDDGKVLWVNNVRNAIGY